MDALVFRQQLDGLPLLEIIARWPAAEAVIRSFDDAAGVCLCCQALFDTPGQMATRFGLDPDAVLDALCDGCRSAEDGSR